MVDLLNWHMTKSKQNSSKFKIIVPGNNASHKAETLGRGLKALK